MEGSMQTEQALLAELTTLRARVAELEHTIQQKAHKAQEQAREMDGLIETLTDGLAVYDLNGNIIRLNAALHSLLRLDTTPSYSNFSIKQRAEMLQLQDEQGRTLTPEEWPAERILRGEILTGQNAIDIRLVTFDGHKAYVTTSGAPLHDKSGSIVGGVILFHDVTERRLLEQRTHASLQALIAMAEVLVQGTDQTTTGNPSPISSLNHVIQRLARLARRVLGSQSVSFAQIAPITGQLQSLTIVSDSAKEENAWETSFQNKTLEDIFAPEQMNILHSGNALLLVLPQDQNAANRCYYLLVPMFLNSRLIGLMSLNYGNTQREFSAEELAMSEAVSRLTVLVIERERLQRERAESQANELALLEANRRMDEFLSVASHELRTPLTTINGNIQLAKRRLKALITSREVEEEQANKLDFIQELLGRAERQVRVQNRLVSDLLDVSRIQANRLELHVSHCDLAEIVREAVEDQRSALPSRMISLDLPYATAVPIEGDKKRIEQALTNYLTNALKYSAPDCPVEVHLEIEPGQARVLVRDEGPGIQPEEQINIWQRFYHIPNMAVLSGTGVGLGLGLHICKTIIERHNGQVGVISAPNEGSTFWFTLPVIDPATFIE